ncbi:hypothetical protein [Glycomyces arizonensis]|uniref:hypothetical protein n=1 Tax=Glycomyces arizonensis TaxID=256035 RepID=UPI0004116E64|nr:hypothetical protein [Glycomyces arizonensis]
MTTAKLATKLGAPAEAGLEPHVPAIYAKPGLRVVGIVELRHIERTEPAPDSDGTASVKLQVAHLEVADDKQEDAVREALLALYTQRTASGTLNEHGELELSESTLAATAGEVNAVKAAHLAVAARHWSHYADRVLSEPSLTQTELRHELKAIADGLKAAARGEFAES